MMALFGGIIIGFLGLELLSAAIHKYLMHGPLWFLHRSHHVKNHSFLEKNDIFIVIFGACALLPLIFGAAEQGFLFGCGIGASLYGTIYFVIHEGIVHRRLPIRIKPSNKYLYSVYKAHLAHHASVEKDDSVSFGLLLFPKKFWQKPPSGTSR